MNKLILYKDLEGNTMVLLCTDKGFYNNVFKSDDAVSIKKEEIMAEKLNQEDDKKLVGGECPKCGSKHFVSGPSGGGALNIACENGHRFWFAPPFTSEYQGLIKIEHKGDLLKAYF